VKKSPALQSPLRSEGRRERTNIRLSFKNAKHLHICQTIGNEKNNFWDKRKLRVSRCLLPINLLFHLPCSLNCVHFEKDYFLESNFSTIKLKATFSHIIFAIQISLLWLCFSCKPSFSEAFFKFDCTWWRFRMLLHSTKDVNLFWLDLLGAGIALPR
jgi:hypothetical protein